MNQDFCHKFKNTLSKFTTGVTIATTNYQENHYGLTVSSFASLSLNPFLVLFNLDQSSSNTKAFLNCKFFNINVLSNKQEELAQHFAKKQGKKFLNIDYCKDNNQIPYFDDNIALIKCSLYKTIHVGDHYIIIGQVQDLNYNDTMLPLVYFNSEFQVK